MPLQWKWYLSAAVPASVALGGSLCVSKNENLVNFIKAQRLSSCIAPSCQYFYLAANVGAAATFDYASYLVYKIGGGFDYSDTTVALGLYEATIASGLVALPLLRTKKAKWLAANTIILTGLSLDKLLGQALGTRSLDKHYGQGPWTSSMDKVLGQALGTRSLDKLLGQGPWTSSMDKVLGQGPWTSSWDKVLGQALGTRSLDKLYGQDPWTSSCDKVLKQALGTRSLDKLNGQAPWTSSWEKMFI
uniref:Uncharacterized protein n=1 Tax=Meloidogyne javanica TaxID=6303 RepID=A0A915N880_MELJA